jgi:alpha-beta hydrolase superfamily lysophospholipase
VHRGLLRAAVWLLDREGPALRRMVAEAEPGRCKLVFVGHSLGAGVAVKCWLGLGRGDVSCYAMAPPRCMSLGLAVQYADVVHSVVLQASFLMMRSLLLAF